MKKKTGFVICLGFAWALAFFGVSGNSIAEQPIDLFINCGPGASLRSSSRPLK